MTQSETRADDPAIPTIPPINENKHDIVEKEQPIKRDILLLVILIIIPFIVIPSIYVSCSLVRRIKLKESASNDQFVIKPLEDVEIYGSLNNFLDMPLKEMDRAIETEKDIFVARKALPDVARERNVLITGNTGTGKSFFVKQFTYYIYKRLKDRGDKRTVSLINLAPGHITDPYHVVTGQNLNMLFEYIKSNVEKKLVILVFDDSDGLFELNGDGDDINNSTMTSARTELLGKLNGDGVIDGTPFISIFCSIPSVEEIYQRWTRRCGIKINLNEICLKQKHQIVERYCKSLKVSTPNNLRLNEKGKIYSIVDIIERVDSNLQK